jgi:3-dehydroquinate dehydratase II
VKKTIYLINGPNLNLLGRRNPAQYGKETLSDVTELVREAAINAGYDILALQSNYEGELITWIQDTPGKASGIILNAGGLTHTSVSLRDAVDFAREQGVPTVEVHLSNIHQRETFRHVSLLTGVCLEQVSGLRTQSYIKGLDFLVQHLKEVAKESCKLPL